MTATRSAAPVRALWLLNEFPPDPGGIATHAGILAPALAALGHEMHLVVGERGPSREWIDGVEVIREPLRLAFVEQSPAAVVRKRRWLADIKDELSPSLYHVHPTDPTPLLHLATIGRSPAPTVLTMHNLLSELLPVRDPEALTRRLMEAARVIVGVSSAVIQLAAEAVPQLAHRMVVIPNAVELPASVAPLPVEPRLVAIGRLVPQKAFDRLLRAMPTVLAHVPSARLDILGDGVERARLESLIQTLGIGDHVTLHGHVHRAAVAVMVDQATVVVAPSRHEGIPYALLEAAARGRPIIGTRTGGIDEVVVHGETGVLIDQDVLDGDPSVLGQAVVTVLDDRELAQRWGTAARRRMSDCFSLQSSVAAHDLVYRSVTGPTADVAVVIPAWNAARHLAATLDSILLDVSETAADVQVLVVDDGSTDDTFEVAASYADRGVEVFRQPNLGSPLARNAGIALTNSRFVAHFDADDLWPRGRLTSMLAALEADPDLDAVFGMAVEFADPDAPPSARWSPEPAPVRMATSGLLRRSAHDRLGGFGTNRNNEQLEWSATALASGLRYATVDTVVLRRRIHSANKSHRHPFASDVDRVAILKQALDARRRSGG
jgi:glycosyltransferase involved in cell wall biosynthesis